MDTIELLAEISIYKERLKNAVEVVRCKDCEHVHPLANDVFGECGFGNGVHDITFFCADGERRSE